MTSIPQRPFQNLVATPSGRVSVQGNARYAPSSSSVTRMLPSQYATNPWDQRSFVDFEMDTLELDIVDEWFLRFVVTFAPDDPASTEWAILLRPAVFFIEQIELRSGNDILEVIPNYSLWQEKLAYSSADDAKLEGEYGNFWSLGSIAPVRANIDSNLGTSVSTTTIDGLYSMLPDTLCLCRDSCSVGSGGVNNYGATRVFTIPFSTVLEKCHHNWRFLSRHNKLKIRVLFNYKSATFWSNQFNVGAPATQYSYYNNGVNNPIVNPSMTLKLIEIYARGVQLTPAERRKQEDSYLTSGTAFTSTVISTIKQQIPQTVNPSTTDVYNVVFNGITGMITNMMAYIAIAPENLPDAFVVANDIVGPEIASPLIVNPDTSNLGWSSVYPTMFTLRDSSGNAVSAQSMPVDINSLANAVSVPNHPYQKLLITYNFAADPKKALEEGEVSGGIYFSNWRLSFNSGGYVPHVTGAAFAGVPAPTIFTTLYQLCQVQTEPGTGTLHIMRV